MPKLKSKKRKRYKKKQINTHTLVVNIMKNTKFGDLPKDERGDVIGYCEGRKWADYFKK